MSITEESVGWTTVRDLPPAILECGGKRSATRLWLVRPRAGLEPKRRRRCALPAHSIERGCRPCRGLLSKPAEGIPALDGKARPKFAGALCLDLPIAQWFYVAKVRLVRGDFRSSQQAGRRLAAISNHKLEDARVCSRRREEAENVDPRFIRLLTSAATIVGGKCGLR